MSEGRAQMTNAECRMKNPEPRTKLCAPRPPLQDSKDPRSPPDELAVASSQLPARTLNPEPFYLAKTATLLTNEG